MNKRIAGLIGALLLVSLLPFAVLATEEAQLPEEQAVEPVRLVVSNTEEFLEFAENCRMDSYSRNLVVTLTGDIDLSGADFDGIPIFCGTFNGNRHTISGLNITAEGSSLGLFRYLSDTAAVKDLKVQGTVTPTGSRAEVGGIAGHNAGRIANCSFTGTVSGSDYVGGLVGVNAVTGIVDGSEMTGTVTGDHFVGGIAGENKGVIRDCESDAQVNTTAQENAVEITDITMESITNSEAANTATDIGGIAGMNSGVIRSCSNRGDVGYRQMGYNIGGIAGSQSGYIIDCENAGQVHGRKEVGGIVGQMEPAAKIEYSVDTLQILEGQLDTLSGLTGSASYNAQSNAAAINAQITALEDHMENAKEAVETLIPNEENPELPDPDTILAAQNTLTDSVTGMAGSVDSIVTGLQGTISTLSRDMQAISNQVGAMGNTLKNADENLNASLTDVSDLDTEADTTGKVTGCVNTGAVQGDLNVGGIVGAMALENDLDQEEDVLIQGDLSLNFAGELRAVVLGCQNSGAITVKKQNGGGIAGWQSMGLVKNCLNTGSLAGESADYVGGIAGQSSGYIRYSSAKSEISGNSFVGGIAGSGAIVTDCRSMTLFQTETEKMGEVLGQKQTPYTEQADPLRGNFYLSIGKDYGAVDGISYSGCAEPLDWDTFAALEGLAEEFGTICVYFVHQDGTVETVSLMPGEALEEAMIPQLPEQAGYTAHWEGLAETDLENIEFDTLFRAVYSKVTDTLQSTQLRGTGQAILLAQGAFVTQEPIAVTRFDREGAIEAWEFALPEDAEAHTLRFALPEGYEGEDVILSVCSSTTGNCTTRSFTVNGSYIVFSVEDGDVAFSIAQAPADYTWAWWAAAGAVALIGLITTVVLVKKKKKKSVPAEGEQ